ncbi:hypothetical protein A8924_5177 [Saccharopolyspora erythraea NRRL 2338]|nr:hypothetical protein [Saccharopolyspora erythraea]PFG97730.1 hypothetical protein A8924_5177 [Saccharopolyspora erythraea NRRL 2338]QRK87877.1 hypothetical protein JQX30_24360 [Saccharopolyspora erythraea]
MNEAPGRDTAMPSADMAGLLRAFGVRVLIIGFILAVTGATLLGLVALLAGAGLLYAEHDHGAAANINP